MRFTVLCGLLVVLLAAVWFQPGEGKKCLFGCIRVRIGKRNKLSATQRCPFTCGVYCPKTSCSVVCANACLLEAEAKITKEVKPFPREFDTFDQDHDGFVTVHEFAKTVNADEDSSAAALKLTDSDGDGRLDEEEFDAAPYHKVKDEEENQEDEREI